MKPEVKELVEKLRQNLLKDLDLFLETKDKQKRWNLDKKMEEYCMDFLDKTKGQLNLDKIPEFIDVLYHCQELDNFGEQWAPTKETLEKDLQLLKNFKVE